MTKMYESSNKKRALEVLAVFRFAFKGTAFLAVEGIWDVRYQVWAIPPA